MIIDMTDKTIRDRHAHCVNSLYDAYAKEDDEFNFVLWFKRMTNGSLKIYNPTPGTLYEIEHIIFDNETDYQRFLLTWG
jgi:hypothetical protein